MKYRINFKTLFRPCSKNDKVILSKFFYFLLSNNVFNFYFENIVNDSTSQITAFTTVKDGMWLISTAFTWVDTPQGFGFWENLDRKWQSSLF